SRLTRVLAPAPLPWPPLPLDAFSLFMLLASSFQAAVDRPLRGRAPVPDGVSEARSRGVPEGARRAASDRPPASLVIQATVVGPVMGPVWANSPGAPRPRSQSGWGSGVNASWPSSVAVSW